MKIKTNENIFGAAKRFTDAFFDGLKTNTTDRAIKAAKKSKKLPMPVIDKMSEIDRAARELEKMLKELE